MSNETFSPAHSAVRRGVFSWDRRIQRAQELASAHPSAAQVLSFYAKLAEVQKCLQAGFEETCELRRQGPDVPLLELLDIGVLLPQYPLFLAFVTREGPAGLRDFGQELLRAGQDRCKDLLINYWQGTSENATGEENFFALAYLQPFAECIATRLSPASDPSGRPTCPLCGAEPVVGVLRPEGHGARRSLICSLCSTEWDYPRIVCPSCGETRFDALCVYTASEFEHVRVEACESCKTYLKTVDLSKTGLAVPVVDEIATIPLSLWAQEKGYRKLQPNLFSL